MKGKRIIILFTVLFSLSLFVSCSINNMNQDKNLPNSSLNGDGAQTRAINTSTVGRLTGVNWFGFETSNYVPHGLWARDYKSMIQQMRDLGFNCIRIPWCNDMLTKTPGSIQINAYGTDPYTGQTNMNVDLAGLSSLQVLDKIVEYAGTLCIKIVLDNHSHTADNYMNETLWYTTNCSEAQWISDWTMMLNRYKVYPNFIGVDIKNEPHGGFLGTGMKPPATWGYDAPGYTNTDWQGAAQRCVNALYAVDSDIIFIVQGVQEYNCSNYWWGGNLQGVQNKPITNIPKDHLWYSVHEYGPEVADQPWFDDPTFPNNMQGVWDSYYWYLTKQNLATVYFGEVGIKEESATNPSSIPYKWLTTWLQYIGKSASFTFWSWNCDSGDTGGILQDDWVSVSTGKYNLIKPYLQPFTTASSSASSTAVSSSAASSIAASSSVASIASSVAASSSRSSAAASSIAASSSVASIALSIAASSSRSSVASSVAASSLVSSMKSSVTASVSSSTASSAAGILKVQFFNLNTAATENTLSLKFNLINTGTSAVNLTNIKMRYYYTIDGEEAQNFWVDYATAGSANITNVFVKMTTPKNTADYYAEIGFSSAAGSISAGANTEVQVRLTKADWSNYSQTNDYSFNSTATSYVDWNKVTAYVSGTLSWGIEP